MDIVNQLPKQYVFLNYLRCHDDIGWGLDYETMRPWGIKEIPHKRYLNDYFTGKAGFEHDEEAMNAAVREDIMLHAYMLTQSGIPMLYSGDELGQVNDYSYKNDPENVLIQDISTGESYRGNSLRIRKMSQRFRETYSRHLTGWKRSADRR